MNINALTDVINLLKQLTEVKNSTTSFISSDVKPKFNPVEDKAPLEVSTPEAEGISSELLLDYIKELRGDKTVEIQNIMVVKNSKKVFEVSFDDHNMKIWKQTFSASKSLVSIAAGFAISEGLFELDTPISTVFQDEMTAISKRTMKDITIRDLLIMCSSVQFAEAEATVSDSWKKGYLSSALKGTHGKTFNYNSLNTYMIGAAVVHKSGQSLTEYLRDRLFDPLGVGEVFWETSPDGIEKGGWGLYIRPEDMAKIGVCMLNGGSYKGKQVIPAEWVREATYPKAQAPEDAGRFDYGYQIWCGRDSDTFLFNGMFGQNMLAFRNHDIIVISNCANNEVFQGSNFYSTTLKYFSDTNDGRISRTPLPDNAEAYCNLLSYAESQRIGFGKVESALPEGCNVLCGLELFPVSQSAASAGIMPLGLQVVNNNYTKGTKSVGFDIISGKFYVVYREKGAIHRFPVGFTKPVNVNMNFDGSVFRVAVSGGFGTDEDGINVLKIRLSFVETPFVRTMKLFFDRGEYLLVLDETPTRRFALENVREIKYSLEEYAILKGTLSRVDDDYLDYKINRTFHPEILLVEKSKLPEESDIK